MHSNRLEIKAAIRKCNASFTAVEQVWTKRDLKGYARFQLVRFISLVSRYRARVRRAREPTPIFKPQTVRKHEWTRLSIYTAIIRGDKQFHISGNGAVERRGYLYIVHPCPAMMKCIDISIRMEKSMTIDYLSIFCFSRGFFFF